MSAFNVTKLMFMETGIYHDQKARPYNTYADDERSLASLVEATQGGKNISAASVAGVASAILRPNTEAGRDIQVTNGWGERRYRFFMEVEMMLGGILVRKILIGYTDHVGVGIHGQALDQNMKMFINNVIVLRQVGGGQWQIWESNHVVVNDLLVHGSGLYNENVVMRPEDVFNTLQGTSMYDPKDVQLFDFRSSNGVGARKSKRSNTSHNDYLAKSMDALHKSTMEADISQENMTGIFQNATSTVREASIVDDSMLRQWDDEAGYFNEGFITYGKLCEMSPSTPHVTKNFEFNQAIKQQTAHTNHTQHFNGSDITSIMQTILANTLAPLAMDHLLTKVAFSATNATLNGMVDARMTGGRSGQCMPQGFVDGIDMTRYYQLFMDKVTNVIMPDVTNNFNYVVSIDVELDVLGETKMYIKVGDEAEVPYVIPTFSDALMSPIIGNSQGDLQSLSSDINDITATLGALTESFNPSPIARPGNNW